MNNPPTKQQAIAAIERAGRTGGQWSSEVSTFAQAYMEAMEAIQTNKTFIKSARYELDQKHQSWEQFPCQQCADKEIKRINTLLAAYHPQEKPNG